MQGQYIMEMNREFSDQVARLIEHARQFVGRTADLTMCVTYFEIGRMIIEQELDSAAIVATVW